MTDDGRPPDHDDQVQPNSAVEDPEPPAPGAENDDDHADPVTLDMRVRVTAFDREHAERIVEGNALDDPFGLVTIEEVLGEVDHDA